MDTRVWGPTVWNALHGLPWYTTLPQAEAFLQTLGDVLPCIYCRDTYRTWLRVNPLQAEHPVQLASWLWRTHEAVNQKLGKQSFPFEALIAAPIDRANWMQAMKNSLTLIALNYKPEKRLAYQAFFKAVSSMFGLGPAPLDNRDQLYDWLRTQFDLPDERAAVDKIRT